MKSPNAIGDINNVSISKPISEETLTFFLIKPYKLNVTATIIPIQGTSPSLINKKTNAATTKKTEKILFLLYFSFKKITPKKTLKIGKM